MTERSYFDSQSDDPFDSPFERPDDHAEYFAHEFACIRRMTDLTGEPFDVSENSSEPDITDDAADDALAQACEDRFEEELLEQTTSPEDVQRWPSHPEILELLESLLDANPEMVPAKETKSYQQPHAVYLPENYEPAYAYPLVVWFHDEHGSEADLKRVMPQISERNYIGVALRGNTKLERGHGWDLAPEAVTALVDEVRAVAISMRREYHIHSERIYLAGFGSGATAAVEVMLRQPDWFGGVLSLNGQFPKIDKPLEDLHELKDKRILLATSIDCQATKVGDVVAAGRLLYAAGMLVGTRVYQDSGRKPSKKMLRDIDSWLMDDICETDTAGMVA
jgi:phospholipase/carboxylesterase